MNYADLALSFNCQQATLYGVLSMPQQALPTGVLFIVGGPQYRAGSHRQFTLLARQLATAGVPVMRFDYRGMGDSEGEPRDFTQIDDDIRAALDAFFRHAPGIQEVVLWGLCDAASAALAYAHQDARVSGLVLLNPWVRTGQGMAKTYLKHYYLQRLRDPDLWKKISRAQFNPLRAMQSLLQQLTTVILGEKNPTDTADAGGTGSTYGHATSLPEKMRQDLSRFSGNTLFILCGNDLTAQEFSGLAAASPQWRALMKSPSVTRRDLEGANHTFSQRNWREQIGSWTLEWLQRR
jgi:exosortase A-associated hydrolase 1